MRRHIFIRYTHFALVFGTVAADAASFKTEIGFVGRAAKKYFGLHKIPEKKRAQFFSRERARDPWLAQRRRLQSGTGQTMGC